MSRSALLSVGLAATSYAVVFATWLLRGWGGPPVVGVISDLGAIVAGGFAFSCALLAARRSAGRLRRAWGLLAAALGCWVFGDSVWALFELVLHIAPFPSLADVGYLMFYVGACLALVLLPAGGGPHFQLRLVCDGVIVAGSLFVIFWTAGLDEVFRDYDVHSVAFAVSLAYPVADLVLLTVALLILSTARAGQRAILATFTVAVAIMTVADGAFAVLDARGSYVNGGLVDIVWVTGLLVLGLSALGGAVHHDQRAFGTMAAPTRFALWMPYVPLAVATICMVNSRASVPLLAASLSVVAAVAGRQFVAADENRRLLQAVSDQALRDPLTGLANRALFHDRLNHALALHERSPRTITLLSIDLDNFKSVNDSLGHVAGDRLLRAVADRLVSCVRPGDTVARLGGDEFAILLEDGAEDPMYVAHRIFDSFDEALPADGHVVLIRASVGVAPTRGKGCVDADTVVKQADTAMYSAKRSGGGVRAFSHELERVEVDPSAPKLVIPRKHRSATTQFTAQLRHALENGELCVSYQPQFSVATGVVVGVEALVRWQHPQRGLLSPDEFLPMARHNDLMGALTHEVLRMTVDDVTRWRDDGFDTPFAINLFPPLLGDLELPDQLAMALAAGGIGEGRLTIEITEDLLLANEHSVHEVLHRLRRTGIRVSIDDFGSGFAGLNYLRRLPVDEIKLDRHLVAPMIGDARAEAIVAAMIDLSHTLGVVCVAEGVENAETAARLADLNCDVMQGYFCGTPMAAAEIPTLQPISVSDGHPVRYGH